MFKNLMLYRLSPKWSATAAQLAEALDGARFVECGATQVQSAGWVSPRGEDNGALIEATASRWLMLLMIETKSVPGAVLKRHVDALAARIEKETGRKPGKKQRNELKDHALLDLLPAAFPKRSAHLVWIAHASRLLAVDAGSAGRADAVLNALAQTLSGPPINGLLVQQINTITTPSTCMKDWLVSGEPPADFTIDRDCELKDPSGEKPVVRYVHHALDIPEVREHIAAGKHPTRLAMTWQGRVSFVLTEGLQIKKIDFLDVVFGGPKDDGVDRFDADAAIATGELESMVTDLIDVMGGEQASADTAQAAATIAHFGEGARSARATVAEVAA